MAESSSSAAGAAPDQAPAGHLLGEIVSLATDVQRGRLPPTALAPAFARLAARPHNVKLHVHNRCNLRCRNCYVPHDDPTALTGAALERLVGSLGALGGRLDLLGGEPLARRDLPALVAYAHQRAGIAKVFLYTNGTLLTPARARALRSAGLHTAVISLHARRAALHDALVGQAGAQRRTLAGISAARAAGIRVYLMCVISARNIDELPALDELARELGAGIIFFPYVPQRLDDELDFADPGERRRALRWAIEHNYIIQGEIERCRRRASRLCLAFTRAINVRADGVVTPCPFIDLPLGDLHRQPLEEILAQAWRNQRLIELLAVPEECEPCTLRALCGGGCRASRATLRGDCRGPDLRCAGPIGDPLALERPALYLPYLY